MEGAKIRGNSAGMELLIRVKTYLVYSRGGGAN